MKIALKLAPVIALVLFAYACGSSGGGSAISSGGGSSGATPTPTISDLANATVSAAFIDSTAADNPEAMTIDSSGNYYVGGRTNGAVAAASAGNGDVFLRKYSSTGAVRWTKQYGGASNDSIYGLDTDSSGNVYVAGSAESALPGLTSGGAIGVSDYFIGKYSTTGTVSYLIQAGTASSDRANAVSVNKTTGDLYVFGRTAGALDGEVNTGGDDCFVVKYNSAGTRQWTKLFGTTISDWCFAGTYNTTTDDLYLAFSTNQSYGGHVNLGGYDVIVVKIDPSNGNTLWVEGVGGTLDEHVYGSSTDSSGNILLAGPTKSDWGRVNPAPASDDAYVAKVSRTGTQTWVTQFGSSSGEEAGSVGVTDSGYIYVTGFSAGTINGVANSGSNDPFLANFRADGTFYSSHYAGGNLSETGRKIAVGGSGSRVYVAGACASTNGSFYSTVCAATAGHVLTYEL